MGEKDYRNNETMLLVTISGILIVVLTVWAQLWTMTAQLYGNDSSMNTVAYGLVYIYWSIFALLASISLMLIKKSVTSLSKACFTSSLVLTFVVLLMSLYSVLHKTISGASDTAKEFWKPLVELNLSCGLDILFIVVIPIILLLICGTIFHRKDKANK